MAMRSLIAARGRPVARVGERGRGRPLIFFAKLGRVHTHGGRVEWERHYYSVPYGLVGEHADVRATAAVIEVFVRGRRVASHLRSGLVHNDTRFAAKVFGETLNLPSEKYQPVSLGGRKWDRLVIHRKGPQ